MAQDVRRVREILDGKASTYKQPFISATVDEIRDYGRFQTGYSYIRTVLCVLATEKPESLDDGSKVILDNAWLIQANSKNYHHFFPRSFLKKPRIAEWQANHVADITIIDDRLNKQMIRDKPPSKYLKLFKQNNDLDTTMKRHLIDLEANDVYEDDYQKFFYNRRKRIAKELQKLVFIEDEG